MIGNLHASFIFRQSGKGRLDYIFNTKKSSDGCFCVFFSYRYNAAVNYTEGRCPGSKAMVFDPYNPKSRVTLPNVNIEDCNYTIAFWIRSNQWLLDYYQYVEIWGWSRFRKGLYLYVDETNAHFCREVSTGIDAKCVDSYSNVVMNNWTHITVTCEQDNEVKMYFNGEIANIHTPWLQSGLFWGQPLPPKETFVIDYSYNSPVIMDLHIFGFALPGDEIDDLYRG